MAFRTTLVTLVINATIALGFYTLGKSRPTDIVARLTELVQGDLYYVQWSHHLNHDDNYALGIQECRLQVRAMLEKEKEK